jgi:hypothetical protein
VFCGEIVQPVEPQQAPHDRRRRPPERRQVHAWECSDLCDRHRCLSSRDGLGGRRRNPDEERKTP